VNISELITSMRQEVATQVVATHIPPQSVPDQWDVEGLEQAVEGQFARKLPIQQWLDEDEKLFEETLREKIVAVLHEDYEKKSAQVGEKMRLLEKQIVLQILDNLWKEHLAAMDQLRQGIFLRGYAGKNPKQEYKREAFALFQELLSNLQHEVIRFLSHVQVRTNEEIDAIERQREEERSRERMQFQHAQAATLAQEAAAVEAAAASEVNAPRATAVQDNTPFVRDEKKVGRNDPCYCGSGKKFKQCHGRLS
jgi:preprotein translocase subunit SecA